jgi:electron transport complex protein RnfE
VVLALSNLFISLLRKIIPDKVRIPAFIVIVASFVTMVQLLLEAYLPSLNASLGIYIPLIVVNCIILGRAESYAYHNGPIPSLFDGIGMGLGFTVGLTLLGIFREFIGSGTFFGMRVFPEEYGVTIFVLAPGAFFVLAALVAVQNFVKDKLAQKGKDVSKIGSGCASGCASCVHKDICSPDLKAEVKAEAKPAAGAEKKEEAKPAAKEETNADANAEAKKEEPKEEPKEEAKAETKEETKAEEKPEEKPEADDEAESPEGESAESDDTDTDDVSDKADDEAKDDKQDNNDNKKSGNNNSGKKNKKGKRRR